MGRPFNKDAYNACDQSSKQRLVQIIEKNTKYRLACDLNEEMYKKGDVIFKYNDKEIICENEVRYDFYKIVHRYNTVHIPIRKKCTQSNCYFVWNTDLTECIFIDSKLIKQFSDNVVTLTCKHEMSKKAEYTDSFIDIPKNQTTWLKINDDLTWSKVSYT